MTSSTTPLIDGLAAFAATASGAAHRDRMALHLADAAIAVVAGRESLEGRSIQGFLAGTESSSLANAAVIAALMRLSEIDDIHRRSAVTASAVALPAALAMRSLAPRANPANFADALFVGHELCVRLALSMGGASLLTQGMWPSYLVAPFGAAAVAGRMLRLSPDRMAHALSLALAQTPRAIGRTTGARPGRWILFGNAVRAGCFAALAAAEGIDCDVGLLSEAWLKSVGGDRADASLLCGPSETSPAIEQTSIKPHCCAKQALAAVHGLRQLLARGLDPATIESIEVAVPTAYAGMIDREPPSANRVASIVSAPGQLALAALRPASLDDVSRDALPRPGELIDFASRVSVRADASLDHFYPEKWPARLTVATRDARHEIVVEDSPGDPALPFGVAEIEDKARRMLPSHPGRSLIEAGLNATSDMSALDALCRYLTPAN